MKRQDIIDAWESHDTLYRQSNGKFKEIIKAIGELLTEDIVFLTILEFGFTDCKIINLFCSIYF